MLVILHQSYFFQGDWYHVQKDAALEGTSSEIEMLMISRILQQGRSCP